MVMGSLLKRTINAVKAWFHFRFSKILIQFSIKKLYLFKSRSFWIRYKDSVPRGKKYYSMNENFSFFSSRNQFRGFWFLEKFSSRKKLFFEELKILTFAPRRKVLRGVLIPRRINFEESDSSKLDRKNVEI